MFLVGDVSVRNVRLHHFFRWRCDRDHTFPCIRRAGDKPSVMPGAHAYATGSRFTLHTAHRQVRRDWRLGSHGRRESAVASVPSGAWTRSVSTPRRSSTHQARARRLATAPHHHIVAPADTKTPLPQSMRKRGICACRETRRSSGGGAMRRFFPSAVCLQAPAGTATPTASTCRTAFPPRVLRPLLFPPVDQRHSSVFASAATAIHRARLLQIRPQRALNELTDRQSAT